MAKAEKMNDKKAAQFVRDHVAAKMVLMGWTPDRAQAVVAGISDAEIADRMGAGASFGDSGFVAWLTAHREAISTAVDQIFKLVALFA